jgi:hypothetical protein
MNSWLAIILWIVIIFIIFVILYYFEYSKLSALAFAMLIGLFVLLICYPWNYHCKDFISSDDIDDTGNGAFNLAIILSIIILIAYILISVSNDKMNCDVVVIKT